MPNDPNDFFWTDYEQAYHRLYGTVVSFEGRPVYVANVETGHADGIPRGVLLEVGTAFAKRQNVTLKKPLNSPGFARFRELPKLGWVNFIGNEDGRPFALFLKRRPVNGTQHGLCSRNVMVVDTHGKNAGIDFTTVIGDEGFLHMQNEDYPPVDFILEKLGRGVGAGVSLDYAVACDSTLGLRYLIRRDEKVGLFAGGEIRLPEHFLFLRDEIQSTPAFNGRVVVQL